MKRLYGVISDQATASEFLNKLYEAGLDDGETKSNFASPIKMISSYTYLTELGNSARAEALNRLHSEGVIQEALSGEAEARVFTDLTKGVVQLPDGAEVAKFADNLYLGVIPPGVEYSWYSTHLVRIMIFQFYTEEVETEGGTETVQHMNEFMLGSNNSNALAPHVAYELTTVYSGDVLVKLAWCAEGCPSTEEALKNVFSALTINKYVVKVENAGHDGAQVIMAQNGGGHSDIVFGAGGPVGGFLLHTMKKEVNGSRHAITIFNGDATPLYTWSAGSKPWDELDSTKNYPVNVAANVNVSRGRIISSDTYGTGSNPGPLITMSALAPICTPAIDDIADTAKWMPQGPHDYSYFDNSGHIVMTKGNSPNTVFFADHGLYLYDGELSDKWSTDGLEVPDIAPSDMVNIKRPEPSSWLPYASRFYAIFDSKDGLSSNCWYNTVEGGDDYDMRFVGTPTINSDGSARFENSPYATNSAWVPAKFGWGTAYNASIVIAVIKFNNLAPWGDPNHDAPRYGFIAHLLSYVVSSEQRSLLNSGEECVGVHHWAWPSGPIRIANESGSWYHWHSGSQMLSADLNNLNDRYMIIISPSGESNTTDFLLYKINSDGTYSLVASASDIYYNIQQTIDCRFYLGSYDGRDTSWRTQPAQVLRPYENAATTWNDGYKQFGAPRASIDCSFLALADSQEKSWKYFEWGYPSGSKTEILNAIAQRYKGG